MRIMTITNAGFWTRLPGHLFPESITYQRVLLLPRWCGPGFNDDYCYRCELKLGIRIDEYGIESRMGWSPYINMVAFYVQGQTQQWAKNNFSFGTRIALRAQNHKMEKFEIK